jgi:mono/diheme cytochrome c family protein
MKRHHLAWRQAIALGMAWGIISPVFGQDLPGNVSAGKQIAATWCAACHLIDTKVVVIDSVPDFYAIANLESTTALSLKVFLQTSHNKMPNFQLTQDETDNVIAYILSMKKE